MNIIYRLDNGREVNIDNSLYAVDMVNDCLYYRYTACTTDEFTQMDRQSRMDTVKAMSQRSDDLIFIDEEPMSRCDLNIIVKGKHNLGIEAKGRRLKGNKGIDDVYPTAMIEKHKYGDLMALKGARYDKVAYDSTCEQPDGTKHYYQWMMDEDMELGNISDVTTAKYTAVPSYKMRKDTYSLKWEDATYRTTIS